MGPERKTFAVGARINETPLKIPHSSVCDGAKSSLALSLIQKPRSCKFRRLPFGYAAGFGPLNLDGNDQKTILAGFKQRLGRDLPEGNPKLLAEFRDFVQDFIQKNIETTQPMEFEEWLGSTGYNDARKNQLRMTNDQLRGGLPTLKQRQKIQTFVKVESYQAWKHARLINSRSDAFKCFAGPRIKAIENIIYKLPQFIKHVPIPERPERIRALKHAGLHYYETDYKAFESHFVSSFMDICECALYRHCLKTDKDVEVLCSTLTGKNRLRTRAGFRIDLDGRRMSGDMCTSLGNGFTNLMLTLFVASRHGMSVDGFVEGDDGLFACSGPLNTDYYKELGFTIEMSEVDDPCHAHFCGMIFAGPGQIITDPRRKLNSFGWTNSCVNGNQRKMWALLKAKSLSLLCEVPQCPILGQLGRTSLQRCDQYDDRLRPLLDPEYSNNTLYKYHSDSFDGEAFNPDLETRQLFALKFGVTISQQLTAESMIRCGRLDDLWTVVEPVPDVLEYCSKFIETRD